MAALPTLLPKKGTDVCDNNEMAKNIFYAKRGEGSLFIPTAWHNPCSDYNQDRLFNENCKILFPIQTNIFLNSSILMIQDEPLTALAYPISKRPMVYNILKHLFKPGLSDFAPGIWSVKIFSFLHPYFKSASIESLFYSL